MGENSEKQWNPHVETPSGAKLDIDKLVAKVLGGRPSPGHEKIAEEMVASLRETGLTISDDDAVYLLVQAKRWQDEQDRKEAGKLSSPPKQPTQHDRITQLVYEKYPTNGGARRVALTLPLATLCWMVSLAEEGTKAREAKWRAEAKDQGRRLDVSEVLSLDSFANDIESVVNAVEEALKLPEPKLPKKK